MEELIEEDGTMCFKAEKKSLSMIETDTGVIHLHPEVPLEVGQIYMVRLNKGVLSLWELHFSKAIEETI